MSCARVILAAVVALAAAPAGAAAGPWSAPELVPGSSGVGFPYDVGVERDGTAVVAFIADGIRVAVRSPSGRWTAARKVSEGRTGVAAPDVEVDDGGEVLVAWTQNTVPGPGPPRGPNFVRVALRTRAGRWQAPRTVGRSRHFVDAQARLAVDARGDAVLAWRGMRSARDELQAAYRPAGGDFGAARSLGEAGIDHDVAIDDRGTAAVSWAAPRPPAYVRSAIRLATRARRGAWSPSATVFADRAGSPQLGAPGDGSLLLAWRGDQQGIGATRTGLAIAAELRPGAAPQPRVLADTPTLGPELAVSTAGDAIVAWTAVSGPLDPTPGAPALYWAARPRGGTFGATQVDRDVRGGPVAMMRDGTAVTVWSATGIRAAVRPPGGDFGPAEQVSPGGDFPVLAAGDRLVAAVWLHGGRLVLASRGT